MNDKYWIERYSKPVLETEQRAEYQCTEREQLIIALGMWVCQVAYVIYIYMYIILFGKRYPLKCT